MFFKSKKDDAKEQKTTPLADMEEKAPEIPPDEDDTAAAVLEKKNSRFISIFVFCIVIPLACFHLYTAYFGVLERYIQVAIHWAGIGAILILTHPIDLKSERYRRARFSTGF